MEGFLTIFKAFTIQQKNDRKNCEYMHDLNS